MTFLRKFFFPVMIMLFMSACTVTFPYIATENEVGAKEGTAKAVFVFGFPVNGGDYSIRTAARNGEINKIGTIDRKVSKYGLGIVVVRSTIVTGN